MRDKRFAVAVVIIIILALVLLYFVFIGPRIQGYLVNQQIQAQQVLINAIISQVGTQGFVQLSNGNDSVVLVKYVPPAETEQQGS